MKRIFSLVLASFVLAACTATPMTPDVNPPADTKENPTTPVVNTEPTLKPETITIDQLGISFTLPAEYWVYQTEGFEGVYTTILSFGERADSKSRYLIQAPLNISILTGITYGERTFGDPSEYIDYLLSGQNNSDANPVETTLFGNKAVTLTSISDGTLTLVGQLRGDQITDERYAQDYFVTISSGTYGSGMSFDKELYDTVAESLAVR